MSPYYIGFECGYDDALGIIPRQNYAPYPEYSEELDSYVSGYYDGFVKGSDARTCPN